MDTPLTVEAAAVDLRQQHARAAAIAALGWAKSQRDAWNPQRDPLDGPVVALFSPQVPAIVLPEIAMPAVTPAIETEAPAQLPADPLAVPTVVWSLTGRQVPVPTAAVLRVVLLVGLTAAAIATRGYWLKPWPIATTFASMSTKSAPARAPQPAAAVPQTVRTAADTPLERIGSLEMNSDPAGATVFVDGKERGVTPLTLESFAAGSHEVVLQRGDLSVRRVVSVKTHETAHVSEMMFAGWVTVFSPFDVIIAEGDQIIRLDDRHSAMLPPGTHSLRFTNHALAYDEVRRVEVKAGQFASLSVVPPTSSLTLTSTTPADVWIDGTHVGPTPLTAVPVELGTRGIVVKNADGVERQLTVTVTTKPVNLSVEF